MNKLSLLDPADPHLRALPQKRSEHLREAIYKGGVDLRDGYNEHLIRNKQGVDLNITGKHFNKS